MKLFNKRYMRCRDCGHKWKDVTLRNGPPYRRGASTNLTHRRAVCPNCGSIHTHVRSTQ